jgi:hypothetical protein
MEYFTRLAFNPAGWQRPARSAADPADIATAINGFGYEDWLFRDEWQLDGWRYAFLRGVSKSRRRLVEDARPFDITLYTVEPDRRRRIVARIGGVECLSDHHACDARALFEERGWFDAMRRDVAAIGGTVDAVGVAPPGQPMFNVRFRVDAVHRFAADAYIAADDRMMHLHRYQLHRADRSFERVEERRPAPYRASGNGPRGNQRTDSAASTRIATSRASFS